jgi:hypothetical protein
MKKPIIFDIKSRLFGCCQTSGAVREGSTSLDVRGTQGTRLTSLLNRNTGRIFSRLFWVNAQKNQEENKAPKKEK